MKNKNTNINVSISLDCVPKDKEILKNNFTKLYDICNKVIDNPKCFYTKEEIERIKLEKRDLII